MISSKINWPVMRKCVVDLHGHALMNVQGHKYYRDEIAVV